ncbi:MAG: neuraminidase-like domain-containing protein, partial [Bacteroidota bacterium]
LRLEPGVEDMSQIQEVWWEWMMNYRIWEANREIFVYPENYLIPTLRKNTTPEFANLSQMLQQSDITKAYVGSAFTNYINGFAEVAELKPVDAYRTQIDDTDTLFLLSRSKTGPYTFYYCEQPESMPWTPWTKIDLTINSAHCSLIYAFNRPFLFWNEIKKNNTSAVSGSGGNVATNNSVTYTTSVMYSFLNQEGKWVQPQTLVDQDVVLFKSDPDDAKQIVLINNALFTGIFDMDAPYWNKVFAFNVTADNYVDTPPFKAGAERLLVMYGPNISNTGTTQDPGTSAPDSNPNSTAFWKNLHDRTEDHNRMVLGQLSGNLSLRPVSILNFSLEEDVLIHREEFLLVDPYQAQSPLSLIKAEMQSSGDVMQISHSGQPITDNRNAMGAVSLNSGSMATPIVGDSFISVGISSTQSTAVYSALKTAAIIDANGNVLPAAMATLDLYKVLAGMTVINSFGPIQFSAVLQVLFTHMGATELFSNVAGNQVKVIPVSTQPGWFVFFAGDEIFLLSPKTIVEGKPLFSTFTKGLTVGDPLLSPDFAIMQYQGATPGAITAAASAQILTALTSFGLIANGRPTVNATLSNITMGLSNLVLQQVITQVQIQYIYNALVNSQIIFSNDFMGDNIDSGKSGQIYTALQGFSLIDPNGRINGDILTGVNVQAALSNLLLQGTITQSQIAGIYQTLAQAPKAIALTYVNQGVAQSITQTANFHFDVIRLSTGAINKISRALFVDGVDSLLDLRTQQIPVTPVLPFDRFGPSTQNLNWPSALDATQVDFDGLYGQYFWEIFYHIPMLVAYSLNTNQQFQDAQKWLQYVFDPTTPEVFVTANAIVMETGQAISSQQAMGIITQLGTNNIGTPPAPILTNGVVNPDFVATTDLSFLKTADPSLTAVKIMMVRNILLNYQLNASSSHFWNFRPFRNHNLQSLEEMLDDSNPAIKVYNDDPFDPFAIARLRIGAFEKSTLIQYIDNLIAWGDQLFTQDSWESITAAYMLYVYAYDLLGPKPEEVGEAPGSNISLNFNEIKAKYPDGIPQFLIDLEHFIPGGTGPDTPMLGHAFNDLYVYFCVPENSNLMARWDTVQDRMYKINNSLNINGVFRQLALFQPPINPLDLVKAAAAGNNIQAMASSTSLLSPYRYSSAINAANGLCGILIELGNSLLSVIEKNDAEKLSVLRNTQEGQILNLITQTKTDRISELQATIASLNANIESANNRLNFYTTAITNDLSDYEKTSLAAMEAALAFNILGSISKTAATIGYAVPQMGSPFAMTYGGVQIGNALNAASGVFEIGSEISTYISQRASTMGGYERRSDDWGLQKQIAQGDVNSITQQIAAANYQLQSAQQDLVVQKKSISQNVAIENYLEQKFSNQDLYQWMLGRISAVYFQTYSLALQVARQAEAAFQFETDSSQTFLSFDYWDNLHKGLTAGEGLRLALNRMDVSYRTQDTRRLEIEKNISLAMLAPDQLLALKTTGLCSFSLTESLFDYDYPGQYARKIKTVSVSIPVVVGPYQNLKAVLTQTKNSVVTQPDIKVVNYLLGTTQTKPASGLREDWAKNQSIAISKGTDDSGMFVLDFQDQRYLPFENTGAVSNWTLSMPIETNRIDFSQLSDVIITVRYTALFDGTLQTNVKQSLAQAPTNGGVYVDSAMQSNAWQSFLIDHSNSSNQTLELTIDPAQIGFFKSLTYSTIILQLNPASGISITDGSTFVSLQAGIQPPPTLTFNSGQATAQSLTWNGKTMPTTWKFVFDLTNANIAPLLTNGFIDANKLLDMQVVVLYQAKVF